MPRKFGDVADDGPYGRPPRRGRWMYNDWMGFNIWYWSWEDEEKYFRQRRKLEKEKREEAERAAREKREEAPIP